jgi:cysteine synthase
VSEVNYETGEPNARYWVLKLIKDNFGPGDKLVETTSSSGDYAVQAFSTARGKKLLILNRKNREINAALPADADGAAVTLVAPSTGDGPAAMEKVAGHTLKLQPFEVAVVSYR